MPSPELQQFLDVLRSDDQPAIESLLDQLDPFFRKIIRLRLIDGRLRRVLDTTDIFQSLLKDFLTQKQGDAAAGQASSGLAAYLTAAVHHKIQTRTRKERRHAGSLDSTWGPTSREPAVVEQIEDRDFHQAVRTRLPEATRLLFDLKMQGLTWTEIASQVGGNPDALRMRLRRTVAAVLAELGRGETDHAC
jgi:DNA-directed RNA polymerase specialized sigma24 family protein